MGILSNWNKIEILIMFWRAKFDQMLLVVTLESVESSQCVIGLLHKKLWSGAERGSWAPERGSQASERGSLASERESLASERGSLAPE